MNPDILIFKPGLKLFQVINSSDLPNDVMNFGLSINYLQHRKSNSDDKWIEFKSIRYLSIIDFKKYKPSIDQLYSYLISDNLNGFICYNQDNCREIHLIDLQHCIQSDKIYPLNYLGPCSTYSFFSDDEFNLSTFLIIKYIQYSRYFLDGPDFNQIKLFFDSRIPQIFIDDYYLKILIYNLNLLIQLHFTFFKYHLDIHIPVQLNIDEYIHQILFLMSDISIKLITIPPLSSHLLI